MIEIGSVWRHIEGREASLVNSGPGWVELFECGQWPLSKFLAEWEEKASAPTHLVPDSPGLDGTPDAHPAWHRGHAHGRVALSTDLARLTEHGIIPTFDCPHTAARAADFKALRDRVADLEATNERQRQAFKARIFDLERQTRP